MSEATDRLSGLIADFAIGDRIKNLQDEIAELRQIKERLEEEDGYDSTDEWTEVRLDIQGAERQIELINEEANYE